MMKTFDLKSLIIGVLLTMIVVILMLLATSESTSRAWEYRVVEGYMGSDYQNKINIAAKEGWEVVSVAVLPNPPNSARPYAVMRRASAAQRIAWWRFWKK